MKVVVTGTRGIPNIMGGVETHCEHLYPRLVETGCDVTVIRRSCYVTDQLTSYRGVKLVDVYAPRKKAFEAIIHTFLACIKAKKLKADVLHIHAIGPALLTPFARMLGLNVVVTNHGPDYDRKKWGAMAKFFLKQGERLGIKYANEVIVISNEINRLIRQKYGRDDAHLIYNGVNKPVRIADTNYIKSLGLESGKYVLAAGRFVPEKGLDLLIQAFSSLKKKGMKLVLAGDADHETPYSVRLKKLAEESGVVLPGFISGNRLYEVFTHARLFALPSFHEGLPISLLEAMSYGLDVLVSDIPANKEIGLPQSDYFQTGNEESLAGALQSKLSGDPAAEIVYDMKEYDWDKIADQVIKVYKKALDSKACLD